MAKNRIDDLKPLIVKICLDVTVTFIKFDGDDGPLLDNLLTKSAFSSLIKRLKGVFHKKYKKHQPQTKSVLRGYSLWS